MAGEAIGFVAIGISAGLGVGFALVLVGVLRSAFDWSPSRSAKLGVVALSMAVSIPLLSKQVVTLGGPMMRSALPMPDLLEESKQDPFIERLLSDHPSLAEPLEERLKEAYRKGGRDRVALEEIRFGQEIAVSPEFNYFVRARSRDLVKVMTMQRDVLASMAEEVPDLCHPFLFGVGGNNEETLQRINDTVPDELSDLTIRMIVNAYDEVPYYDRAAGRRLIYEAQTKTTLLYGDNGMSLLAGERAPASADEEKTVCLVFVSVLTSMLDEGEVSASLGFRAMFDAG